MSRSSIAEREKSHTISAAECRAMRALEEDDDYTRTEIAFIFECTPPTVRRHVGEDCQHIRQNPGSREYSLLDCLAAFREVYEMQDYERMSQNTYDSCRPGDFPSSGTIQRRFGSWIEAREAAWGENDA